MDGGGGWELRRAISRAVARIEVDVDSQAAGKAFSELCDVMDRLRRECPWDRAQTVQMLKPYLLEETYEVLHAMDSGDVKAHREELGDLVFQVVFHARLRQEEPDGFNVVDVCHGIRDKLIRRHPHIWGAEQGVEKSQERVLADWETLKRKERGGASVLSGVPPTLPALARAQRTGEKAARVGFDWENAQQVLDKVKEEIAELEEAMAGSDGNHQREELGDVLFALAQLARFMKTNAEDALRESTEKFARRFRHVESALAAQGRTTEKASMDELNALWDDAKRAEKEGHLS